MSVKDSNSIIKYKDDEYVHLKNEFEQVQQCIGAYITHYNTAGALHLLKEIGNNALDECINENSPANLIEFKIDEESQTFEVSDNGRGIPFDKLVDVCTKKHTSTKIGRKFNKYSTGQNGVGIKVTVALSEYFAITSYRGDSYQTIEFINCEMKKHPITPLKKPRYGTTVRYSPSEKWLGKLHITNDMVLDWIRRMSYLIPDDITMKVTFIEDGKEIKRTYKHEDLRSNVEYLSSTLEFNPIMVSVETEHMDMDVAFAYSKYTDEMVVDSYCNYAHTIDGGAHVIAAERAICDYFTREARNLDPNSKYEVLAVDCKKGLIMALNCKHDNPKFGAQAKEKVENSDIIYVGRKEINKALTRYFTNDTALLRKIISYLRQMARIRLDAHKVKGISVKKQTTFLDDAEIPGFWNTTNRNGTGYRELLITEGDSAANAVLKVRNPAFQAIYKVQGVLNNVFSCSDKDLMQKPLIRNLITVLGCGMGKDFDIKKLKWSKIIILSDADIDGHFITSLISAFFIAHLPKIVEEGRLYKSIPPLYLLSDKSRSKFYKNTTFLFDKSDYKKAFFSVVADNVDMAIEGRRMTNNDKIRWLNANAEYLTELVALSKRTSCPTFILENVCWTILETRNTKDPVRAFKTKIEKVFPEMKYNINEYDLSGAYKGEFISLIIDDLFMNIAQRYMGILSSAGMLYIGYRPMNSSESYERVTIGDFEKMITNKYDMDIEQRFKGIGEIPAEYTFSATLNPRIRKLIRYKINDYDSTMEVMELLHGKSSTSSELRKDMLSGANITYDDIDN